MFDLVTLIQTVGYIGLFAIVFSESGLFLGAFLPGDSLLLTAGLLAAQEYLNIVILLLVTFGGAVLGDSFGYAFGRLVGPRIFSRKDSRFFHKDHIVRAQHFFQKHGGKTIILARFLPFIRTFAPILAGVGRMHYPTFLLFNIVGGLVWAVGMTMLGYYLGNVIPNIDRYFLPILFIIIVFSSIPPLYHIFRGREEREAALDFLRRKIGRRTAPKE